MTLDEYDTLRLELTATRKQQSESKYGLIPESVPYLDQMLANAISDEDRALLYSLLISECSRARNDSLYVDCLRRRARDLTNDPISHAGLAVTLAGLGPNYWEEALSAAYEALDVAKAQGRQVRYCATSLVRVALLLDDYAVLQRALRELIDDAGQFRLEDTRYEFDFVEQIDPRRCDADLLASYKALA